MQQQTALFLLSKNGEYSLGTRPIPQPSQGELLVKVKATALNPEDWKVQKYGWLFEEYPTVAGSDISSTFPVALSAAYFLFFNEVPHGMGLKPLDSSGRKNHYERHTEKLKALGATHIIERTIPLTSIRSHLAEILNTSTAATGGLFGYIYDAISEKETQLAAYDLLRPSGKLAIVLPSVIETKSEDNGGSEYPSQHCSSVTSMIENGVLMPTEIEILPGGLGGIVDGLKMLEAGKVSGKKLVASPEEHPLTYKSTFAMQSALMLEQRRNHYKIRATSINGMGWKIPKWGIIVDEYPAVLGYDVACDLITVGEGVDKFVVGNRVLWSCPHTGYGGYQSYCKLKADFTPRSVIPTQTTYEQASTFPIAFFAAYQTNLVY
ncbi:hypothetical protein AN958_05326 [Leucoagaricus sp. SymC.cos]|nr:hypothetical protein AN958_05326 [Leucoagaricus sp. SymC.cos]